MLMQRAYQLPEKFVQEISSIQKEICDISEIILGMECGGSDTTSGLASNPTCGICSDKMVELGGTSILSETTEFIGAEHVVAKRGKTEEVSRKILELVRNCEKSNESWS